MDDRCEICGMPGLVVQAHILDPWGGLHVITVHIACENNRVAKMRAAGMAGQN